MTNDNINPHKCYKYRQVQKYSTDMLFLMAVANNSGQCCILPVSVDFTV